MKPRKGKAVAKKVDGKKVSYGQAGKTPAPNTKKANSYCSRSAGIKKCANPPCPNQLSRQRWGCVGKKSVKRK